MRKHKSHRQKHHSPSGHRDRKLQKQTTHTETQCACACEDLLPLWFPYAVVIATITVRVYYVCQPRSWWILHPDEIFQSLEVAFSDVYGHGFLAYEYLPPPGNSSTLGDLQEAAQGMYGLRSFLYPRAFSLIFTLAAMLGLDSSPFLVGRIFNAVVTSLLPLTLYHLVLKLFRCRLQANVTCALAASSLQLSVYGTHTLVNSFIATPFFLGLSLCFSWRQDTSTEQLQNPTQQSYDTASNLDPNGNVMMCKTKKNSSLENVTNLHPCLTRNTNDRKTSVDDDSSCDVKQNTTGRHCTSVLSTSSGVKTIRENGHKSKEPIRTSVKNDGGVLRYLFECLWEERSMLSFWIGGFLVGVTSYVRVDLCLFFILVFVPFLPVLEIRWKQKILGILSIVIGGTSGILLGGFDDFVNYGMWFLSPLQWFRFNILSNRADILFGADDTKLYINMLFPDGSDILINALAVCAILFSMTTRKKDFQQSFTAILLVSYAILFAIYASVNHKEGRFLHNLVVLQILVLSSAIHFVLYEIKKLSNFKLKLCHFLLVGLIVSAANSYQRFPSTIDRSISKWGFNRESKSSDFNTCLNFIGQHASDVRGVFSDVGIYSTGGYTILKHDVPLLAKFHNEWILYRGQTSLRFGKPTNLRLFNHFSDYIDTSNTHYLGKVLSESNEFNYIVTSIVNIQLFHAMKYTEVFRSADILVLNRVLSHKEEIKLNSLASQRPVGTNATTLEYEAGWLITAGLYDKAVARLETALQLSDDRVRPFQQLIYSHQKLGQRWHARQVHMRCEKRHGQSACVAEQERVVLHEEYRKFSN